MRGRAALLILLPGMAAAQDGQSRDALLTALAMNDCAVTEDETPRVLGSQGFDGEFVRHELGQMVLDETAFLEAGYVLRVKAEYCPPVDPAPTPAQALRSEIEERGCSIDDRTARELVADIERIRPVVLSWIERGEATVEGRSLTLSNCP